MSGSGRASKVHILGTSGNLANVTDGNALKTDGSFRRFYPIGKIRVGNLSAVRLPNIPCSLVRIRNPEGNGNVWVGGSNVFLAKPNIMAVIYETEMHTFEVSNANELSLIADNINTDVLVYAFSNEDITFSVSNPAPPDFVPPTVSSTFPSGGFIALNSTIYFLFNEEIDDTTINNTNFTVSPAVSYTVTKDSVNPFKVLIIPSANLATSTLYTITATTGVKDVSGNAMLAPSSFTFTTTATAPGADTTPPTVIATNPVDGTTDVAPSISPTISFSEAIFPASISVNTIKVYKDTNNSPITVAALLQSVDQKTVTLTLSGLEYGTKYRIEVISGASGIKDTTGNALATTYITYFTTMVQTIHVVYQLTGDSEIVMYSGGYNMNLEVVATKQSILYNEKILKYTFDAKKTAANGVLSVVILDSSNNIIYTFEETLSTSAMTAAYVQYTLNSTGNTHVMAVGDKIGLSYQDNGGGYVHTKYAAGSAYNGTDSYLRLRVQTTFVDYTDSDTAAIMQSGP